MHKLKPLIIDLVLLFIITIPAFFRLLNNQYFSMHDDQHLVRLFLLDQGLGQGYLYPRWVGGLGFGFGYPLFNFYPPLIYYLAEFFHLLGFSLIWSVKLLIILGFCLGAVGVYLLVKKLTDRLSGVLSATLYTYFFYHAVLVYVRGALAEFFSLAILPFVFLTLHILTNKINWRNVVLFGISIALLILSHPLIALPSMIFIGVYYIYYLIRSNLNFKLLNYLITSLIIGLGLSAFFWLPSFIERKHTLTDQILTTELASYKLHYIYPQQFIYSPWGYGGSGAGLTDGMTFQLGKIHLGLIIGAIILSIIILINKHVSFRRSKATEKSSKAFLRPDLIGTRFLARARNDLANFFIFVFLFFISLFMTTEYSSFIWDNLRYLWYLQFPWRFLTFTNFFIALVGGYGLFFSFRLLKRPLQLPVLMLIVVTVFTYQKYFKPERLITTNDKERTSFKEISWRISRTSYEFVPKGVKTTKTELGTTILDINKNELPKVSYQILDGEGEVREVKNNFAEKTYLINAQTPLRFRLNSYYFPGWKAYLNSHVLGIDDNNKLKLSTVKIPKGNYELKFVFKDTPVRKTGNLITAFSLIIIFLVFFKQLKKVN